MLFLQWRQLQHLRKLDWLRLTEPGVRVPEKVIYNEKITGTPGSSLTSLLVPRWRLDYTNKNNLITIFDARGTKIFQQRDRQVERDRMHDIILLTATTDIQFKRFRRSLTLKNVISFNNDRSF